MPPKSHLLLVGLTACLYAAPLSGGQTLLSPAESARVEQFFTRTRSSARLDCSIQPRQPFLDFSFRFDVAYIFSCPLRVFGGRDSMISAFTHVTPQGGKPVTFAASYHLPGITSQQAATLNSKLAGKAGSSGGFAAGEGRYEVHVLLLDRETKRTYRKSWHVRVARSRGQRAVPETIPPGTVLPIASQPWTGRLDSSGKGLRVSVWLNAAAMNPRAPRLRVWDRAFLLDSLASLLARVPCASVRLIAFNLDQQREVFRRENFDREGFTKLDEALQTLELGTVSYRVLQHGQGWLEMLLGLANREVMALDPGDVVIILGPRTHYLAEVPRELVKTRETPNPHFFCFQFFPRPGFPDTLHSLTRRLDGDVYEIYSPGDFARAIQKMLAQAHAGRSATAQNR